MNRGHIAILTGSLILSSLLLSVLLTRHGLFRVPAYQPGDIARADIIIPMDALIEDETATQARREEARAKALPVYRFNPSIQHEQVTRLKASFAQSRTLLGVRRTGQEPSGGDRRLSFRNLPATAKEELRSALRHLGIKPPVDDLLVFLVHDGFSNKLEERIVLLLQDVYPAGPVTDDTLAMQQKENIHKVDPVTEKVETIPVSLLSTLAQIRKQAGNQISQDSRLASSSRPHIRRIVEALITPNLIFDDALTRKRQEEDVRNVDHVLRKLKKGKMLLRQGDEVGEDHLIQIEAIRKLSLTDSSMKKTIAMSLLIGILLTTFVFLIRFTALNQWSYPRLVAFLILTLILNVLLLKASWFVSESVSQNFMASPFNDKDFFFYLLPFASGAMLVTLLAGESCALIFILFCCILAMQAIGTDAQGSFYILINNLAGVIFTRKATQRIGIVGAGFKLGFSAALLFLILRIAGPASQDLVSASFGACLAFLSGPVNAVFLVFMLPLCERLFMVTTEIRLSELGNLNLEVIRDMIWKAPGTYNHSIAVGTLCEGAAKAVGINPLFLRIASLYHDIGKTDQPSYFVENQQEGNPHDEISPRESVRILQGHVTQGISIAKRAHLPSSIVDMIPQHHGTKLIQFFFEKAKKEAAGSQEEVREEPYRYAGPKPQTKAAAILMLADGIEAASRTLTDHSQARLFDLIQKIITDAAEDGQLSECDITLSELNLITHSFLDTLSSYHHGRIAYPGFDFNNTPNNPVDGKPPTSHEGED